MRNVELSEIYRLAHVCLALLALHHTVDPNAFRIPNALATLLASTINARIHVQIHVHKMPSVALLVTLRCVSVWPDMLAIRSLCAQSNESPYTSSPHLVFPIPAAQMPIAESKMVPVLVNVCLSTTVIRTKDVAQNAFLTLTVRRTKLVFETNARILAEEVVAKMPNVK